jgi:hypothetical protein
MVKKYYKKKLLLIDVDDDEDDIVIWIETNNKTPYFNCGCCKKCLCNDTSSCKNCGCGCNCIESNDYTENNEDSEDEIKK